MGASGGEDDRAVSNPPAALSSLYFIIVKDEDDFPFISKDRESHQIVRPIKRPVIESIPEE